MGLLIVNTDQLARLRDCHQQSTQKRFVQYGKFQFQLGPKVMSLLHNSVSFIYCVITRPLYLIIVGHSSRLTFAMGIIGTTWALK